MKPASPEMIAAHLDAARNGAARIRRLPARYREDIASAAVLVALERVAGGGLLVPDDARAAGRIVAAFLYEVARRLAVRMADAVARELRGDLSQEPDPARIAPEPAVDPLPRLEARSELRAMVRRARIGGRVEGLPPGMTLLDYLDPPEGNVNPATVLTRRNRLAGYRRKDHR